MGLLSALGAFASSAGGGGLLGSALGLGGSMASAKMSAKEAQRNREFQERMSNTAYQRAATDMEAAGLNRILALGSPATTPGGSVASFPDFGSSITSGLTAGSGMASTASNISLQENQSQKILKEIESIDEDVKQKFEKTKVWQSLAPIIESAGKDAGLFQEALKTDIGKRFFDNVTTAPRWVLDTAYDLLGEYYLGELELPSLEKSKNSSGAGFSGKIPIDNTGLSK